MNKPKVVTEEFKQLILAQLHALPEGYSVTRETLCLKAGLTKEDPEFVAALAACSSMAKMPECEDFEMVKAHGFRRRKK